MNTLKFKTNINCGGCVRAVTPTLDGAPAIQSWAVDTASADKVLTVTCELPEDEVVELVEKAGFKAEAL